MQPALPMRGGGCGRGRTGGSRAARQGGARHGVQLLGAGGRAAAAAERQRSGACRPCRPPAAFGGRPRRSGGGPAAAVQSPAAAATAAALRGRFVIPADEVRQLQQASGLSMDSLLLSLLEEASLASRPPISKYRVGAVGLGGSGAVYIGANLEFPGNPLNQSVHGEQFLLANLQLHKERELAILAISAAPCGHCRQFYSELACADKVRFVFGYRGHTDPEVFSLSQLLPARFGPLDLLEDPNAPLLLEQQHHSIAWAPAAQQLLQQRRSEPEFVRAAEAALAAAQSSYAPYTHCPSGVALVTEPGGAVAAGGYIESAAHNPGLPPLQAAVVGAIVSGCLGSFEQVREVVLVELAGALVKHERMTCAIAASISPDIRVTVLPVKRREPAA